MKIRSAGSLSFYLRLLISSLLIVAISLLFSFGVNQYAFRVLEAEISEANSASLNRVAELFDARLGEISSIFSQLSLDADANNVIEADKRKENISPILILRLRRKLETIQNSCMEDLFLYCTQSDKVLPRSHGAFQSEFYFRCYYPDSAIAHERILTCLQQTNAMTLAPLPAAGTIIVMQSVPVAGRRAFTAVAGFVISRAFLSQLLREWAPTKGAVLLVGEDGSQLAASSDLIAPESLPAPDALPPYSTQSIGGEQYVILSVGGAYGGYRYLSVVPVRVFWERLDSVRKVSALSFITFSLAIILVALFLTKRNYAPISDLVDEIRMHRPDDETGHKNEIDYIRRTINSTLDEKARMTGAMRDSILSRALNGRLNHALDIRAQFARAGITLVSDAFSVALIQIERNNADELPSELNDAAIRQLLTDLCPQSARLHALSGESGAYTCVINPARAGEHGAMQFCEQASAFFTRNLQLPLTMAYGGEYEGVKGIRRSNEEAQAALAYRAVRGPGAILSPTDIIKEGFRYELCARGEAERLLIACIRDGEPKPDAALYEIRSLCCAGEIRLPEEFKCYFFDMRDLLRRVADKLSLPSDMPEALSECDNLIDFEKSLKDMLKRMHAALSEASGGDERRVREMCARVRGYVIENLSDSSLSVVAVGNQFGLSGQYLSRLFRDDQGMTIAAFITNARIERSKQLLAETSLSIEDISERCGFLSSTTYIRLFKKTEGVTPGAYRRTQGDYRPL